MHSYATGISDNGWVVGTSATAPGNEDENPAVGSPRAFVYRADGSIAPQALATPGTHRFGNGINNSGQVTGSYVTAAGTQRAFVTQAGGAAVVELGTLGGANAIGHGINQSGKVAGVSTVPGGREDSFEGRRHQRQRPDRGHDRGRLLHRRIGLHRRARRHRPQAEHP